MRGAKLGWASGIAESGSDRAGCRSGGARDCSGGRLQFSDRQSSGWTRDCFWWNGVGSGGDVG